MATLDEEPALRAVDAAKKYSASDGHAVDRRERFVMRAGFLTAGTLVAAAVALFGVTGCAEQATTESVGVVRQGISSGILDSDNAHPYVVHIAHPTADPEADGPISTCTGTLITPFWVLTAAHCFEYRGDVDDVDDVDTTVTVRFGVDSDNPVETRVHSPTLSGPVFVGTGDVSQSDDETVALDYALLRLNGRVPASIARPLHPQFGDACSSGFTGTLVGYGGNLCTVGYDGRRNYQSSAGWARSNEDTGARFMNEWIMPAGTFCAAYDGSVDGDSGGPLLKSGQLCGVISGHTDVVPVLFLEMMWAKASAFDTMAAETWMNSIVLPAGLSTNVPAGLGVLDAKGNWDGECPDYLKCIDGVGIGCEKDQDNDEVVDLCDSCPLVWNPEQLLADDDPDEDGIGEACDLCPGTAGPNQTNTTNRNYETELAIAYPGASSPPPLDRTEYPIQAEFDEAQALFLSSFRPDACDPVPVPVIALGSGGLPEDAYPEITLQQSSACLLIQGGCSWKTTNQVNITPMKDAVLIPDALGVSATVGARWCDCALPGVDLATRAGRLKCQKSQTKLCVINEARYSDSPLTRKWLPLATQTDNDWQKPLAVGEEWTLPLLDEAPTQKALWDFQELGPAYAGAEEVQGVLWGHTTVLSAQVWGLPSGWVPKFGNDYAAGYGSIRYTADGQQWAYISEEIFCKECPMGWTHFGVDVINPVWNVVTPDGLQPVQSMGASAKELYRAVALGTTRHVAAGETLEQLASMTPPGGDLYRGIGVTGEVVHVLTSTDTDETPEPTSLSLSGGPTFGGGEGVAMSGTSQQVFVIGGTNGAGIPNLSGWVLDIASEQWLEKPLVAAERPKVVLASAFRLADGSVYFLDQDGNGSLHLKRWTPVDMPDGGAIVALAKFSESWSDYQNRWLSFGPDGDLLLALADTTGATPASRLARFVFTAGGVISLDGAADIEEDIVSMPLMRSAAVGYIRAGGTFGSLALGDLVPAEQLEDAPIVF